MESNLDSYFGSHKIINGEYIDLEIVEIMPKIKFIPGSFYYTILIVDPDAPSKTNPIYKYWLHMLIINNNEEIVPFEKPNPPKGSGPHRYYIYLFQQEKELNNVSEYPRKNFDLEKFIGKYNLKPISKIFFRTERK